MELPSEESGLTHDVIIMCMDLIANPSRFSRATVLEKNILTQLLRYNNVETELLQFITHNSNDKSHRFLKFCLKQGLYLPNLDELSVHAKHPETRRVAIEKILSGNTVFDKEFFAKKALADKSLQIQRMALDYILEEKPKSLHHETTYRQYVSHKYRSIVDRAMFGLKTLGVDYVVELRAEISVGKISKRTAQTLSRHGIQKDGEVIYLNRHRLEENIQLELLHASARLNYKPAIHDLEKLAVSFKDDAKARKASKFLYHASGKIGFDEMYTCFVNGGNLVARGYIPFIQKLPIMQLARMIVAIDKNGDEGQTEVLLALLGKKRIRYAFSPTEREVESLRKELNGMGDFCKRIENAIGLELC